MDEGGADSVTVRLPKGLGDRIDRLLELREEGLVSRNAYVVEVVRRALEQSEEKVMHRGAFAAWLAEQRRDPLLEPRSRRR